LLDFQARNQLGTPGGRRASKRGHLFKTMFNSFNIRPTHFSCGDENFSRGGFAPSWLQACGLLYITKSKHFLAYFMRILNSCSLVKFDLANQGLRQPVQPHTFNAQLLVFDETVAQPHFAVVNCSDVGMSVLHSPVLTRSLIFLQ